MAERFKKVIEVLKSLGVEVEDAGDVIRVKASKDKLRQVAEKAVELGYDHLASVEGVDWIKENQIEVIYHAESYEEGLRGKLLEIRVRVDREDPRVDSLVSVWPNALFLERETWDLMGVVFEGHPDLRRILMPPEWDGPPPLRKDFKVETEGVYVNVE